MTPKSGTIPTASEVPASGAVFLLRADAPTQRQLSLNIGSTPTETTCVDERDTQDRLAERLRGMGLDLERQAGGRCWLGRIEFGGDPLLTASGPFGVAAVEFSTVGSSHIKCLRPEALFQLPMISIAGCIEQAEIEGRIRAAWIDLSARLRFAYDGLSSAGVASEWDGPSSLVVPLELDIPDDKARVLQGRSVALPTRGPLEGKALDSASDRVWEWPADAASGTEVAISIHTAMEDHARGIDEKIAARRKSTGQGETSRPLHPVFRGRDHQILLVGPYLVGDVELHAALRRRGFRVTLARSANDARSAFDQNTFEAVLTDAILDRAEGLELIPTLAHVPGIGQLPIVLVDDRARESRREAARALGAAGYLVRPIDAERLAPGLERLISERPRRRFERFAQRLAVEWDDGADGVTTMIGRLGMFVSTERTNETGCVDTVALALPETGAQVRLDVETLYRVDAAGGRDPGIGVRIRAFPDGDEDAWIDYLSDLNGPAELS